MVLLLLYFTELNLQVLRCEITLTLSTLPLTLLDGLKKTFRLAKIIFSKRSPGPFSFPTQELKELALRLITTRYLRLAKLILFWHLFQIGDGGSSSSESSLGSSSGYGSQNTVRIEEHQNFLQKNFGQQQQPQQQPQPQHTSNMAVNDGKSGQDKVPA